MKPLAAQALDMGEMSVECQANSVALDGDVQHRPRRWRDYAVKLIFASLLGLVAGCIIPTRVGGYAVTGTVVDRCTGAPVEGVTVSLRYTAVNAFGLRQVDGEPVLTNELGKFYVPPRTVTMMGGSGGLAGGTQRWPTVNFYKAGYKSGIGVNPGWIAKHTERGVPPITPQDYQGFIWEMLKNGESCPVGSRLHEEAQPAPE